MKRLLVSLCCVALFAGVVPLVSMADESEGTTSTTTDSSPSSSHTTSSTTTTTAAPDFTFTEYSRTYDESTGVLSVVWNYASAGGADVIAVNLDGRQYVVSGSQGRFSVNLGQIAGGSHSLQYVLRLADGSTKVESVAPLERGSTNALILTVSVHPGSVAAHLTDETGKGVADYPLQFTLNRSTTVNRTTDQNGRVEFAVTGTLTSVSCVAPGRTVGVIKYIGTSASWQQDGGDTTTTPSDDDDGDDDDDGTTTTRTRWSATTTSKTTGTVQTFATINGAGTTKAEGSRVAVNVTFDEGVVKAFGLENDDFNEKARLLMDEKLYTTLVGNSKATVMMTAGYNAFEITDQHISSLVSGKSKYSKYTDVKRVAVTLGLQFVDEKKTAVPIAVAPEGSYTVRLPVPASMTDCPVLAVAVLGDTGLSHLIDVQVKNGYLEFVTNGFTSIAVLGFGDHALKTGGGIAWQLIVLLAAGILLLAGAGLLMYFFVWRKPPKEDGGEDDGDSGDRGPEGPGDAEGEAPAEPGDIGFMIDRPETPEQENTVELGRDVLGEAPADGEESRDLYSSDSRRPPRNNE